MPSCLSSTTAAWSTLRSCMKTARSPPTLINPRREQLNVHVTASSERDDGSSFVTDPGACGDALSKNDPAPARLNLTATGLVTDA
eukprot:scaffold61608_cov60-Phaeocystis_antarctica.AAC.2